MPDPAAGGSHDAATSPSPALLAAQQRLEQLRASCRPLPRQRSWLNGFIAQDGRSPAVAEGQPGSSPAPSKSGLTHAINKGPEERQPVTIRIQAALALAMLRTEQVAAGRIWLLLRVLDETGRGWLFTDQVRNHLAHKEASLHVCGLRQLRNLLNQGEGVFWTRQPARSGSPERIWLRSPARVASALGLDHLPGHRVPLPLASLLGGIGHLRAHLYAAFHHTRQEPVRGCINPPISRARLAAITHVPPRTQRLYDKRAGVKRQANYAIGDRYTVDLHRERAWQHGRAVFHFVDHHGRQGPIGRQYIAWRLPNSYAIDNSNSCLRIEKRRNLRPVGLVTTGAQGNDRVAQGCFGQPLLLFHSDGHAAARSYNRDGCVDAYWPVAGERGPRKDRPVNIWHVLVPPSGTQTRAVYSGGGNFLPGL